MSSSRKYSSLEFHLPFPSSFVHLLFHHDYSPPLLSSFRFVIFLLLPISSLLFILCVSCCTGSHLDLLFLLSLSFRIFRFISFTLSSSSFYFIMTLFFISFFQFVIMVIPPSLSVFTIFLLFYFLVLFHD